MYRLNSSTGGVTCDKCNLLIDSYLNYDEYVSERHASEASIPKDAWNSDLCGECRAKEPKKAPRMPTVTSKPVSPYVDLR